MRSSVILAALLGASLLLSQSMTSQDSVQVDRGIMNASKQIKLENPAVQLNLRTDSRSIRDAYKELYQVDPGTFVLNPDDTLKLTWQSLRTGDEKVPDNLNFGSIEFLRHGLSMQNHFGRLSDKDYLEINAKLLGAQRAISPEMLRQDQEVVMTALPALRSHYKQAGFSDVEANEAAVATWYQVRLGPKAVAAYTRISAAELEDKPMGRLAVISDPPGAAVNVSGIPWKDATRTAQFVEAGTVTIVLSKTGYDTLTEPFPVQADKYNEFSRPLHLAKKP